jgi:hypothetical protein
LCQLRGQHSWDCFIVSIVFIVPIIPIVFIVPIAPIAHTVHITFIVLIVFISCIFDWRWSGYFFKDSSSCCIPHISNNYNPNCSCCRIEG